MTTSVKMSETNVGEAGRSVSESSFISVQQLQTLERDAMAGLSEQEAAKRRSQFGANTVPEEHEHWLIMIGRHFWAPVPWMLEATIALQLAIGKSVEAMMIAGLLIFNVIIGVFQKSRANAALELLKSRLFLMARVKRDGRWTDLPAEDLVPGDVVRLSVGVVVPADTRILRGSVLLDQSMLTGESMAVDLPAGRTAYAGAMVRRGEAIAEVTATGTSTYFGRAAELVRIAHVESAELKVVLALVRDLSIVNAALVIGLVGYADAIGLPSRQIILLVLTAMLSAVPVALPATFTLAAALGARRLALKGVLLTRLGAMNEAAMIDVLCADKTGTLTKNELAVATVRPLAEAWTAGDILGYAALASSAEGRDLVDAAICGAARATRASRPLPTPVSFTPFDPATKVAEATALDCNQSYVRIVKGAPAAIEMIALTTFAFKAALEELTRSGYRTLAVASGPPGKLATIGLIALNDPPRADSAALLAELKTLGVRTVMVTGDAAATAETVARQIGLDGPVCPPGQIPRCADPKDFSVYAGVFPEEKFHLVTTLQRAGHAVGMCGDGANDAPALRQAQMGIAVSTATDVAKAAASIVLTEPGLAGIVSTINEGRAVFQRVRSYVVGLLVNKCVTLLVLGVGLVLTRHAVLTPMLQALIMVTNDFVNMSRTADRATPSPLPNAWHMRKIVLAALPLALLKLSFAVGVLAVAWFPLGFSTGQMQTLTFLMFVFAGQAVLYALREQGHMWQSRPATIMLTFTLLDIVLVSALAVKGTLMPAIPISVVVALLAATVPLALAMDRVKVMFSL